MSGSSRSRSQAHGSSTSPVGRCHVWDLVGATGCSAHGGSRSRQSAAGEHGTCRARYACSADHARVDRPRPVHRRRSVRRPLPRRVRAARGRHRLRRRGGAPLNDPGGSGAWRGSRCAGVQRASSTPPRPARASASSSRSIRPATPTSTSSSTAASPPASSCASTPPTPSEVRRIGGSCGCPAEWILTLVPQSEIVTMAVVHIHWSCHDHVRSRPLQVRRSAGATRSSTPSPPRRASTPGVVDQISWWKGEPRWMTEHAAAQPQAVRAQADGRVVRRQHARHRLPGHLLLPAPDGRAGRRVGRAARSR